MGPQQHQAAARAASPLIAATTTDQHLQAAIAAERPDLRAALAANPAIYPELRDWLAEASRRTAAQAAGQPEAAEVVEHPEAADDEAGTEGTEDPAAPEGAETPTQDLPAVAPVQTPAQAPGGPERPRRHRTWVIVVVCLLVLAVAAAAVTLLRRGGRPAGPAPSSAAQPAASATASAGGSALPTASTTAPPTEVSRCPTEPAYEVLAVRYSTDGMEADVRISPTCEGGDVLSGTSNLVTLSASRSGTSLSSSPRLVAAVAVFDLSEEPLAVPAEGTEVTFVFESSVTYVNAGQIDENDAAVSVTRDQSGETTVATRSTSADPVRLDTASAADSATMEAIWLDLLRDQADADAPIVSGQLDGVWVPQLSSKKPGLIIDGTTWDAKAVWEHYLTLRALNPNAVLLYSDDWSVFDAGGQWWVIVVAEPFATAEEANAWCDAQGWSKDDCLAKYLKVGGSSEGTTVLR